MTNEQREAIRLRIESLYARHGRLTPDVVVTDAEDPASPLHTQFEWDDSVAGAAWRLEQARTLIRSIHYIVTTETAIVETVAYVRDPKAASDAQGYIATEELRKDRRAAKAAIVYECGRANAMLQRARDLSVALGLVKEAERALASVETLRDSALAKAK